MEMKPILSAQTHVLVLEKIVIKLLEDAEII